MQRRAVLGLILTASLAPVLPSLFSTAPGSGAATAAPSGTAAPTLRLSAIPDQNPEKLNRLYPLVAKVLSKQLGVNVRYVPMVDYPAAVGAFRTG
ncbi:MAG: PhnD/SsuA/transferrin family substrate-binding protein, partial [Cyanobium sp.]